jgi:hypothetical protein
MVATEKSRFDSAERGWPPLAVRGSVPASVDLAQESELRAPVQPADEVLNLLEGATAEISVSAALPPDAPVLNLKP